MGNLLFFPNDSVYDQSGNLIGPLRSKNKVLAIDGLWAIYFAPVTATNVDPGWLFFAAGPGDEADGLFGYITNKFRLWFKGKGPDSSGLFI